MDLRCPKCNSTDLKKVSLAYQEGLFRTEARTRIRGILVGSGGPGILVGSAETKGTHQTSVSKRLSPPKKWSYLRLVIGFAAVSLMALILYIHNVMANSTISSSLPVKLYGFSACFVLGLGIFLTWRHNHSIYTAHFAQWDRSFVCRKCGAVSEQDTRGM